MKIFVETTTGRLVPNGIPAQLDPGGVQNIELGFLTNGVLGLLPEDTAITLFAYNPTDLGTPLFSVNAWTSDPDRKIYKATVDTLADLLAWIKSALWRGKITYGVTTTPLFHWIYGGDQSSRGKAATVVLAAPGPGRYLVPLLFQGQLTLNQVFGYFKAQQAGQVLGIQISAQEVPTGADVHVRLVDGGAVDQGVQAVLSAGNRVQETIFAQPLPFAAAAVLEGKLTQIGSGAPGAWLTANLICQALA
jgi:hypothetical protein